MENAGGQLVGAAFSFLSEMIPSQAETTESKQMAELMRNRLAECLEKDEDGRMKLTVTLPDAGALDSLATALSGLLANRTG